eukprot:CAMPEP_0115365822 /NCGR_PEP_ID=MMETSP0270-20121206/104481_1 /TAXON_ID=71861 /ORGANISM="Scrippsiella trochoidea, Strain CCMP3099" /LENGTH=185 /DNA_ID=CAMNT_0002788561 /DNA_START=126 /DNA_END=681 /DNA_ORIENTATION=-
MALVWGHPPHPVRVGHPRDVALSPDVASSQRCLRRRRDEGGDPEGLRHGPRLRVATLLVPRLVSVEDLHNLPQAARAHRRDDALQSPGGLRASRAREAADAEHGLAVGADQPRPDGAVVIRGVAGHHYPADELRHEARRARRGLRPELRREPRLLSLQQLSHASKTVDPQSVDLYALPVPRREGD